VAAVSSFYAFAILSDQFDFQNPIEKYVDTATQRVAQRHRGQRTEELIATSGALTLVTTA
jgi:hypothetical protein